jgi:hypothetical protein
MHAHVIRVGSGRIHGRLRIVEGFSLATGCRARELELHARICRCIDEGRLPVHLAETISMGCGLGSTCDGCGQPLTPSEIEYNVADPRDATAGLSLHLGCYVIWQIECVKRIRKQQDSPGSQPLPPNGSSNKNPGGNVRAKGFTRLS